MNSKWKSAIGYLFIILTIFYLLIKFNSSTICSRSSKHDLPSNLHIPGFLIRAQQAYWLENRKFATTDDLIREGYTLNVDNHEYSIEITENAAFNQSFVTIINQKLCIKISAPFVFTIFPKENTLTYTLSSAIFALPTGNFKQIVCKSNSPGWHQVNKPFLRNGEPVCGDGTTKYRQ